MTASKLKLFIFNGRKLYTFFSDRYEKNENGFQFLNYAATMSPSHVFSPTLSLFSTNMYQNVRIIEPSQ